MTTYRVLATPKYRGWWSDSQHEFKEEFTEYGFIEKISGKTLRNAFSNLRKLNFILAFAHNIFSFSTYIYFNPGAPGCNIFVANGLFLLTKRLCMVRKYVETPC